MGRPSPRRRALAAELAHRYPHLERPDALVAAGEVLVNGFPRTNPASLVDATDSIRLHSPKPLRGTAKLVYALDVFEVSPRGRVALDLGAAAGGFTQALLDAGATRVYAVDVGHGQLRGSLRRDARVVNLERTNLADLNTTRVPEPVGLISIDLSYLSIAGAVPQLDVLTFTSDIALIALVKPAYELGLARPPADDARLSAAVTNAAEGLSARGWSVVASVRSPVRGSRGAIEFLVHARRSEGAAAGRSGGSTVLPLRTAPWNLPMPLIILGLVRPDVGLPDDPEFRAALMGYAEWGTRLAVHNSQPGAEVAAHAPVPRWGWGVAPPYVPSSSSGTSD